MWHAGDSLALRYVSDRAEASFVTSSARREEAVGWWSHNDEQRSDAQGIGSGQPLQRRGENSRSPELIDCERFEREVPGGEVRHFVVSLDVFGENLNRFRHRTLQV